MNEKACNNEEKLLLAKVFLRKYLSKDEVNQAKVDMLAHEMACILRVWQIKKCNEIIKFLKQFVEGEQFPDEDPDGVFNWLISEKKTQSPFRLVEKILVSPCSFSCNSVELAKAKFKCLAPTENTDLMIKGHEESNREAIWEKNDELIQILHLVQINIFPIEQIADIKLETPHVVSGEIYNLATALIVSCKKLEKELYESVIDLRKRLIYFIKKHSDAAKAQKKQENNASMERIIKLRRFSDANDIDSLLTYLSHTNSNNKIDNEWKIPTDVDLAYIIYKGVDPYEVCNWQPSLNNLLYFFFPNQENDPRKEAWTYASTECQVNNLVTLFSYLKFKHENIKLEEEIKCLQEKVEDLESNRLQLLEEIDLRRLQDKVDLDKKIEELTNLIKLSKFKQDSSPLTSIISSSNTGQQVDSINNNFFKPI